MARNKVIKGKVVAFRLTEAQYADLVKAFSVKPPLGIKSASLMARKLTLDYVFGRIAWRNKKEEFQAPELYIPELSKVEPVVAPATNHARRKASPVSALRSNSTA